jgi:hypothetical protein
MESGLKRVVRTAGKRRQLELLGDVDVSRYDMVIFLQEPPIFDPHESEDFQNILLQAANVLSMVNLDEI